MKKLMAWNITVDGKSLDGAPGRSSYVKELLRCRDISDPRDCQMNPSPRMNRGALAGTTEAQWAEKDGSSLAPYWKAGVCKMAQTVPLRPE
jgi:hypothetical protein